MAYLPMNKSDEGGGGAILCPDGYCLYCSSQAFSVGGIPKSSTLVTQGGIIVPLKGLTTVYYKVRTSTTRYIGLIANGTLTNIAISNTSWASRSVVGYDYCTCYTAATSASAVDIYFA